MKDHVPNLVRVRDYYKSAKEDQHLFVGRYPHPFLVIVGTKGEIDDTDDSGLFNTVVTEPHSEDQIAIAEGRMLSPEAAVYPVIKRNSIIPGASQQPAVIMVGRASNCDVVIPIPSISKSHFYIAQKPLSKDQFLLADSGSTNGTILNHSNVTSGSRHRLSNGDEIVVGGEVVLKFFLSEGFWEILHQALSRF